MPSSRYNPDATSSLFKIAAIVALIYFAQRAVIPVAFGWVFYSLRTLNIFPSGYTSQLIELIGRVANILMAAPLIPVFLIVMAAAWFKLSDHPSLSKGPAYRALLIAFGAHILLIVAAVCFAWSAYAELLAHLYTPVAWSPWLSGLFTVAAVVNFIAYTMLVYYLDQQNLISAGIGALLILGLMATNALFFSLPVLSRSTYNWPWTVLAAFGFGLSLALWQLSQQAKALPNESNSI
jgi:hypothetical protein